MVALGFAEIALIDVRPKALMDDTPYWLVIVQALRTFIEAYLERLQDWILIPYIQPGYAERYARPRNASPATSSTLGPHFQLFCDTLSPCRTIR